MMKKLIKLIDGRKLTVYPNDAQKADGVVEDKFGLDTTGQYITLGGHRPKVPSLTILERGLSAFNRRLFVENAWFLLKNADEILSDSRMFFVQLDINNHLAYTGTNGFLHPTIGIYVEWWLHYKDVSITPEGNLIWFIAGSPLTGAHSCCSVKPDGKTQTEKSLKSFSHLWKSFIEVNTRYNPIKNMCEAYTLEETLARLHGEEYRKHINALRQECIDLAMLYDNKPNWPADGTHLKKQVKAARRDQMQIKRNEIMRFYENFAKREEEMEQVKAVGNISEYRKLLHELALESTEFVEATFGRNVNRICLTDVINFAKYKKSLES